MTEDRTTADRTPPTDRAAKPLARKRLENLIFDTLNNNGLGLYRLRLDPEPRAEFVSVFESGLADALLPLLHDGPSARPDRTTAAEPSTDETGAVPHWRDDPPHDIDEWCESCAVPATKATMEAAMRDAVDKGLADVAAGRTVPWSEVRDRLPAAAGPSAVTVDVLPEEARLVDHLGCTPAEARQMLVGAAFARVYGTVIGDPEGNGADGHLDFVGELQEGLRAAGYIIVPAAAGPETPAIDFAAVTAELDSDDFRDAHERAQRGHVLGMGDGHVCDDLCSDGIVDLLVGKKDRTQPHSLPPMFPAAAGPSEPRVAARTDLAERLRDSLAVYGWGYAVALRPDGDSKQIRVCVLCDVHEGEPHEGDCPFTLAATPPTAPAAEGTEP